MKYDPILIAGPPRTGSTMLAGLLYHHGVWIGEARVTKFKKTNSNIGAENTEIKNYLKDIFNRHNNWNRLPLPEIGNTLVNDFKSKILSIVNSSSPWLVKTSGILYDFELWNEAFSNAKWLFPSRPFKDIMSSFNRHPKMKKRKHKKQYVLELWRRRDELINKYQINYKWVYPDEFMKGSNKHAREVIEFCDLKFDEGIFNNWIKPEMWNRGKNE